MNSEITVAKSDPQILDCYPVMAELRPHIRRDEFLPLVKKLAEIAVFS